MATLRGLRSLPPSLALSVLSFQQCAARNASNWSRRSAFPGFFFNNTPITRSLISKRAFWLIPFAGGLTLYLIPTPKSPLTAVFASPTLIPCPSLIQPTILSPAEPDRSISSRILSLLNDKIWEPILTTGRFIYLFILFMPVILSSPILLMRTPAGERSGAIWWYELLVSRMETAGPTFIKLAQWAASRADLFPPGLCERLGRLHSRGTPHDFAHTKAIIEDVFQRPFDEIFDHFDYSPIGTGAIAQVYRAKLNQHLIPPSYLGPKRPKKTSAASAILQGPPPTVPTAAVAIKVLHPRVAKVISRDLSIMSFFANLIALIPGMQWLSLPEEVDVFGCMMSGQLDLRHEADNLMIFEDNFGHRNVPVTFPRPLRAWSTKNLLVEEYQNALPLEAFLKNGAGPFDDQVATVGLDAFLNMLLLDNFVHSDLHPGNIMIKFIKPTSVKDLLQNLFFSIVSNNKSQDKSLPVDQTESDRIVERLRKLINSPSKWRAELTDLSAQGYIPEVVFIDAGLVTTLNATDRRNFLDLFRAVAEFDGYRAGHLMVERCRTPSLVRETETFALKMQHIVLSVKRKTFSLGQIKISDILTEVLRAVRTHHVKMEGDFINTVISILLLEGIGRQLDPGLDLFKGALPILRQLGRQMAAQESTSNLPTSHLGALLKGGRITCKSFSLMLTLSLFRSGCIWKQELWLLLHSSMQMIWSNTIGWYPAYR